jgi:hypothetical protein
VLKAFGATELRREPDGMDSLLRREVLETIVEGIADPWCLWKPGARVTVTGRPQLTLS